MKKLLTTLIVFSLASVCSAGWWGGTSLNSSTDANVRDINVGGSLRGVWDSNHVAVDFNATDTTLRDVNGLSVNVSSDCNYSIIAELFVVADSTGDANFGIGGTEVNSVIVYDVLSTGSYSAAHVSIIGFVSVTTGGTLTIQFAQNTASGVSTVKKGSWMKVEKIK